MSRLDSRFDQYFSSTHPRQRLEAAVIATGIGRPVVLLDDEDRENEADLIVAAERIDASSMAQMIRDGSGIVCLCLSDAALNRLQLPQMVTHNGSRNSTAFAVSIEARDGVSTGVSAADRVTTIRAALSHDPAQLVSPGHVFPLRGRPGGVLERRGHTEGSIELAKMAGLSEASVLCELMSPDGTMMRGDTVIAYAEQHGLPVLTIEDLVWYRQQVEQGEVAAAA